MNLDKHKVDKQVLAPKQANCRDWWQTRLSGKLNTLRDNEAIIAMAFKGSWQIKIGRNFLEDLYSSNVLCVDNAKLSRSLGGGEHTVLVSLLLVLFIKRDSLFLLTCRTFDG